MDDRKTKIDLRDPADMIALATTIILVVIVLGFVVVGAVIGMTHLIRWAT